MLKRLKERIELKIIAFSIILSGMLNSTVAYAGSMPAPTNKSKSADFDFLTKGTGNGAFNDLTETVKDTGASAYSFMMVVGIIGLVFATVALGISIAFTKNATKKSENKSHLPAIAGGAMLIFGAIALIGLVQTIALGI